MTPANRPERGALSRRALVVGAGAGGVAVALGALAPRTAWWPWGGVSSEAGARGERLAEPEVLRSRDGVLEAQLVAAAGQHRMAARDVASMAYNGGHPGPTLRVAPGDVVRIELVNDLDEPTNLHVHGLRVSPEGLGDDIFRVVEPGETRRYEYRIPDDHETGVFWYHPHAHGHVADQLWAGLCGAIVVVEDVDDAEAEAAERVLVVTDVALDDGGTPVAPSRPTRMRGRAGDLVLVDGQAEPELETTAGAVEDWYLVNACCSRYLSFRVDGLQASAVARDQGPLPAEVELGQVVVPPGGRVHARVEVPEGGGSVTLVPFDRGGMMGGMGGMGAGMMGDDPADAFATETSEVPLLTVATGGSGPAPTAPARSPGRAPADLRGRDVATRRTLTMSMGMGGGMMGGSGGPGMSFTIDGRAFDADRTDQSVRLGTVEEWTIRNDSMLAHPFHLHVWPMQVLRDGSGELAEPLWLDTVDVPPHGEVVVRVAFDDHPGRTVYHCHVLDHEDLGMMGVVDVE